MSKEDDVYRMIQAMIAEHVEQQYGFPEPAIVASVDLVNFQCTAQLMYDADRNDDGTYTPTIVGPLRICAPYAGNGYGIPVMPQKGDEVLVIYHGGKLNDGYVVGRLFGPDDPPPAFNNGEFKLVHASGSTLLYDTAGNVKITVPKGPTVQFLATGEVSIVSTNASIDMNANGQIAITGPGGVELLNLINTLLQNMLAAAPAFVDGASGPSALSPQLVAQMTTLQGQLQSIVQT
jgi:hypothetical protein